MDTRGNRYIRKPDYYIKPNYYIERIEGNMGLGSFLKLFRLDEDMDEDYDEEYEERYQEPPAQPVRKKPVRSYPAEEPEEEQPKQRNGFLGSKPKVVPMNNRASMQVRINKPTSFDDSQEICNMLLAGQPVIVSLEGFNPEDAQRIMDFISGCIYAINGKYQQISKYIFIFSPENVDIAGDSLNIEGAADAMPTLNREF